jgi:hypothetical protein
LPHQWLIVFVGVALLVLGFILVCYILLLRYKAVRLHKEQSNDEVSPGEASQERQSWWEPPGSPEKASEEPESSMAPQVQQGSKSEPDPERRSWWRRIFGG